MHVYLGSTRKFCPPSETVGLQVPALYIKVFSLFSIESSIENCPSETFASADNIVCRDAELFGSKIVSHIL
jgi:hypothetical protein